MSAIMKAIFAAQDIKASARVKRGNQTETVKLHKVPNGISEQDFMDAAKMGVDVSVQVKAEGERARTLSGKGTYGEDATEAMREALGLPEPKKEEPAKPVNRIPAPSRNQAKAKDGAVAPAKE